MTYLAWLCGMLLLVSISAAITVNLDFSDSKDKE
jgi:hypothetical protein